MVETLIVPGLKDVHVYKRSGIMFDDLLCAACPVNHSQIMER